MAAGSVMLLHQPTILWVKGTFGRDWATGFTPALDKIQSKRSRRVKLALYYHTLAHADVLDSLNMI